MDILKPIGNGKYKVDFGSRTEESFESIFESNYEIEEFDIYNELKTADDFEKLKRLFQSKGSNVEKLTWSNWSTYGLTANEIVELLNCLPKLMDLKFSSWYTEFTDKTTSATLEHENLCCLEVNECKNFIIDFLISTLPEDKLKCIKIDNVNEVDSKVNMLIKKHPSIKCLNITGRDYKTFDSLKELKLDNLRCILYENEEETDQQRAFLKELIKSQKDLKSLDLLNDMDYSFNFVDDSVFAEICALSKLENLLINVDGITVDGIKSISKLTSLKSLECKTNRDCSLSLFNELSSYKNNCLEKLVLHLWSFEIPAETYTALGVNYENLKTLKITLGTRHKLSFFATALPNVEDLSIRFGESNNPVEFSQVYDAEDDVKNSKMKKLHLSLWGSELIDQNMFFKCLGSFKTLESLDVETKFPFTADFVNRLSKELNTIKVLKLTSFKVANDETFPDEIVTAFKELSTKLKYAKLTFSNVQSSFAHEGMDEQCRDQSFTFEPFIEALKDVYQPKEFGFANIRVHNNLVLYYGIDESENYW